MILYRIIWVCVCVWLHVCVSKIMWVCVCIYTYVFAWQTCDGSECDWHACDVEATGKLCCPLLLLSRSSSWVRVGIIWACGCSGRRAGSKPWQSCLLHLMHFCSYRHTKPLHLVLYVGAWDPHSDLHAYTASIPPH